MPNSYTTAALDSMQRLTREMASDANDTYQNVEALFAFLGDKNNIVTPGRSVCRAVVQNAPVLLQGECRDLLAKPVCDWTEADCDRAAARLTKKFGPLCEGGNISWAGILKRGFTTNQTSTHTELFKIALCLKLDQKELLKLFLLNGQVISVHDLVDVVYFALLDKFPDNLTWEQVMDVVRDYTQEVQPMEEELRPAAEAWKQEQVLAQSWKDEANSQAARAKKRAEAKRPRAFTEKVFLKYLKKGSERYAELFAELKDRACAGETFEDLPVEELKDILLNGRNFEELPEKEREEKSLTGFHSYLNDSAKPVTRRMICRLKVLLEGLEEQKNNCFGGEFAKLLAKELEPELEKMRVLTPADFGRYMSIRTAKNTEGTVAVKDMMRELRSSTKSGDAFVEELTEKLVKNWKSFAPFVVVDDVPHPAAGQQDAAPMLRGYVKPLLDNARSYSYTAAKTLCSVLLVLRVLYCNKNSQLDFKDWAEVLAELLPSTDEQRKNERPWHTNLATLFDNMLLSVGGLPQNDAEGQQADAPRETTNAPTRHYFTKRLRRLEDSVQCMLKLLRDGAAPAAYGFSTDEILFLTYFLVLGVHTYVLDASAYEDERTRALNELVMRVCRMPQQTPFTQLFSEVADKIAQTLYAPYAKQEDRLEAVIEIFDGVIAAFAESGLNCLPPTYLPYAPDAVLVAALLCSNDQVYPDEWGDFMDALLHEDVLESGRELDAAERTVREQALAAFENNEDAAAMDLWKLDRQN